MNNAKNKPISVYLWSIGAVIVSIITVLFLTVFNYITHSIIDNNITYTTEVFKRFETQIKNKTTLTENLLNSIAFNRNVAEFVLEKNSSQKLKKRVQVDNFFMNVLEIEPLILQIALESSDLKYFSSSQNPEVIKALETLPIQPNSYYDFTQSIHFNNSCDRGFLFSTSMYDIWSIYDGGFLGRVTLVIDIDMLGVSNFNDKYDTTLLLLDSKNNVITSNKETSDVTQQVIMELKSFTDKSVKEIKVNNEIYIINFNTVDEIQSSVVSITPRKNIIIELNKMRFFVVVFLISALVFIISILAFLHRKIIHPLTMFGDYMQNIKNQTVKYLKNKIELSGYKEIVEISTQFNSMIEEINSLTHRLVSTTSNLYESELQKKQSELLHLRSQINPHFLYNTLECIIGMSYIEGAEQTGNMIKCLSKIFKYSVKGNDTVTVESELNIIKAYISIQQVRFHNLFTVNYDFDEYVLNCKIPKMILQPLIENAVMHGMESKGSNGELNVGGRSLSEESLMLWVEDNGVGIEDEKLEYFNSLIKKTNTTINIDSIGLENVINRLRLVFGDSCSIKIFSKKTLGTKIEIVIPQHIQGGLKDE